jgi:hypothetical protein
MSLGQPAYGSRRYFDARERFALVGEAGAFTDPLYSPGGDYIALANDWVTDLVRRDLRGEGALAARAELYDRVLALRLRSTRLLYEGLYGTLGSFDVFAAKWDLDLACYLNLWVEPYVLDLHLDDRALRRELDFGEATLGILRTLRRAILAAEAALSSEGRLFAKNLGHAMLDPGIRFSKPDFGTADSHRRTMVRVRDSLQRAWDELAQMRGRPRSPEPIPIAGFASGLLA